MKHSLFNRSGALWRRVRANLPALPVALPEPLDFMVQHAVPDGPSVYQYLATIQARRPGGSEEEVYEDLVRDTTQSVIQMTAGLAAPSIIPGIGTLLSALDVPAEMAGLWALQAKLVLSIAGLYGYDLSTREQRWHVLTTVGLVALPTAFARHFVRKGVQRLGTRFLGVVGAACDVSLNVASTVAVARRARALYRRRAVIEADYRVIEGD